MDSTVMEGDIQGVAAITVPLFQRSHAPLSATPRKKKQRNNNEQFTLTLKITLTFIFLAVWFFMRRFCLDLKSSVPLTLTSQRHYLRARRGAIHSVIPNLIPTTSTLHIGAVVECNV